MEHCSASLQAIYVHPALFIQFAVMSNISLASATGSRLDSAAKHIVVARLCTDFYSQFLPAPQDLLDKKLDYMARRDEICLGIGRPFNPKYGFSHADNKAYVPVITNVAVLQLNHSTVADYYTTLYDARSIEEAKEVAKTPARVRGQNYFPSELFFSGISLTQAFAHPHTGDTALSSMIGGLKTIKNGRFPVYAGDPVMWYFEFEADAKVFLEDGSRVPRGPRHDYAANLNDINDASVVDIMDKRKRDHEYAEIARTKKLVYPKSYLPGLDGKGVSPMDKRRVFGIALGYASPYDLVDIMICRQSL